ncbi:glycosyl hydrolase, partial [Colletotrichum higginsianum]
DAPSFGDFPATKTEDGSLCLSYSDLAVAVVDESSPPPSSSVSSSTSGGSKLRVSVTVTNTGSRAGREVVPLYVTPAEAAAVWRPARELKAFDKVLLQPGESREVVLEVEVKVACSYWDEAAKAWRLEEGRYGVQVGDRHGDFSVLRGSVWNGL